MRYLARQVADTHVYRLDEDCLDGSGKSPRLGAAGTSKEWYHDPGQRFGDRHGHYYHSKKAHFLWHNVVI